MKLEFKNLGYVKNMELDLDKDLIILCGQNNTGKTYVAYALYGLMKFRSVIHPSIKVKDKIRNLFDLGKIEINILDLLETNKNFLKFITDSYIEQISSVFASDKNTFSKTELKMELGDNEKIKKRILSKKLNQEIGIGNTTSVKIFKEENSLILNCIVITNEKEDSNKIDIPNSVFLEFLSDRILNIITDFIFYKTYIAPAERIAINIFSKELSLKRNILVDKLLDLNDVTKNDDPLDLVKRRATRYPLPIRDSLEIAEDLNNFKKVNSEYEEFAVEIEKEILRGQVIISKDGDVQFKPEKAKSLRLPIHLTASVVKSLSSLVIYFRHIAKKGDFIIIDEPELNLHPDNQVIIARVIAKIVNKGFKVLVNTHSDYIIRELNNLIMLNKLESNLEKYNLSKEVLLDYKNIGAYLFQYNQRKITNLKIDSNGFEVETIDEITSDLNNRSQELYFNINFG